MMKVQQVNLVFRRMLAYLLLLVTGVSASVANAADEVVSADGLSAEEAVSTYVEILLGKLEDIQGYYESDRSRYFNEIEMALDEFVDFREVARGVMARYSTGPDGATDEQLTRFAEVFRGSIVDFYGTALASYGDEGFEIVPASRQPSDPANNSNVRMRVLMDNGSTVELQYTMFLNDDQLWRLKNVYVEGVNLRRQYHSQFDSLMARYNYDIDAVIDNWESELNQ